MFTGSLVPIITPFRDGKLDRDGLERVIEWVLREGSDGIIPCGTTGESATLSHEEHEQVIEWTIQIVRKRVPVVAGTGSNSTAEAIRLTSAAKRAGADGALLISPYYNKPTQDGIYRHYAAVAEAVSPMPIIVYNIPGRTGSKIEPATLARLATVSNVAGVKEATGSLEQAQDVLQSCGPRFAVYCGEDALNFSILALGGHGLISAVGNVIPGALSRMTKLCRDGHWEEARKIHFDTLALVKLLFIETNPIPVKTACSLMGLCTPELRLPMTAMTEPNLAKLQSAMRALKLIA